MDMNLKSIRKWAAILAILGSLVIACRFLYSLETAGRQNQENILELRDQVKGLDRKIDDLTLAICYLATKEGRDCYGYFQKKRA